MRGSAHLADLLERPVLEEGVVDAPADVLPRGGGVGLGLIRLLLGVRVRGSGWG